MTTQEATRYRVIFKGVKPGVSEDDAKQRFADLTKIDSKRIERLFARPGTAIKADLTRERADHYVSRLEALGLQVEAELMGQTSAEPLAQPATDHGGTGGRADQTGGGREDDEPRAVPFEFTGQGFEYFKIWIVNILLSIVTLGIYSAWAKVRNKQYFYGNTYLDGSSFSYTADPVKILIGRIIAFVFLVVYTVVGELSVVVGLIMGLTLFVLVPWIVCKSLRFNAHYSRYRNVPFAFNGKVGEAAMAYILWPLLVPFTLGILAPFAYYQQRRFIYNEHAYGTTEFNFHAGAGDYYKIFLLTIGIIIVGGGIAGVLAGLLGSVVLALGTMAAYLFAFAYFAVAVANLQYNNLTLDRHSLSAQWEVPSYLWVVATNTILTVLTLGIFIPWAKVRLAHYKAEHTTAVLVGDMDNFVSAERENVNALGESVGDLFDIEVGF